MSNGKRDYRVPREKENALLCQTASTTRQAKPQHEKATKRLVRNVQSPLTSTQHVPQDLHVNALFHSSDPTPSVTTNNLWGSYVSLMLLSVS